MLSLVKWDSKLLLLTSKIFLMIGACLGVAGMVLAFSHAMPYVILGAFGVAVLIGGVFLRRKALALHRRFEWREGHVPA